MALDVDAPGNRRLDLLRNWILAILFLGLLGTGTELLLLEHYEEPPQFVPLVSIVLSVAVLAWHASRADRASRLAVFVVMTLSIVAGFVGFLEHFNGAAEFQRELKPDIGGWELLLKVMRAKAPPLLAPGMMIQIGLLGWAYAWFGRREPRR